MRTWHYLGQRSFWIDEARLALNIGTRSYGELLHPLDYDQAAPPLFLWTEKALGTWLGMNELALRLFPYLAGLILLALLVPLARHLLRREEVLVALLIVATFPFFVHYSNELKPYGVDAAISVGLTLIGLRLVHGCSRRDLWRLGICGVIALWASTPAVFTVSAIGACLLWRPGSTRGPAALTAAIVVAWMISFGTAYAVVYGPSAASPYLQAFWEYRMLAPSSSDWPTRVWVSLNEVLAGLFSRTSREEQFTVLSVLLTLSILVLIVVGVRRFLREIGPLQTWLLVGPLFAVLLAATCGFYPFALRLILFAAPVLVLLAVAGGGVVLRWAAPRYRPIVAVGFTAALAYQPYQTVLAFVAPTPWAYSRQVIQELTARAAPSEPVYIEAGALPAWIFYTTEWASPDRNRLALAAKLGSSGGQAFENASSRRRNVFGDGDSVFYAGPGRKEIYGLYTGMQLRWGLGLAQQHPDTGWAENEVRRIFLLSDSTFWTLFVYDYGSSTILREQIQQAGARRRYMQSRGAVYAARYSMQEQRRDVGGLSQLE